MLVDSYLSCGALGLASSFLMNLSGDLRSGTSISIYLSKGNFYALLFLIASFASSIIAGILYRQQRRHLESLLMIITSVCVVIAGVTSMRLSIHGISLALLVLITPFPAVAHLLRTEIDLQFVVILAFTVSLTYVFGLVVILPGNTVGLGIAETVWFFTAYISNGFVLNLLNLRRGFET